MKWGGYRCPTAKNKAIVVVAHALIVIIWHVLATGKPYDELGADYFTRRQDPDRETRRLIARLEALGHQRHPRGHRRLTSPPTRSRRHKPRRLLPPARLGTIHVSVVLIGAEPRTRWLPDDIKRDRWGFVVTGTGLIAGGHPPESWPLQRPPMFLESSLPGVSRPATSAADQ